MKKRYYARRRVHRRKARARFFVIIGILTAVLAVGIFFIVKTVSEEPGNPNRPSQTVAMASSQTSESILPTETPTPTLEPTPTPVPSLSADLIPHPTDNGTVNTDPSKFGFTTEIKNGDTIVDSYQRTDIITFGSGDEYTALEGVITFRGNNYRNAPSFGAADIKEGKLSPPFITKQTGAIGSWGGAGWTGQPLVVKWPDKTRQNMTSLFDKFKNKEGFTEVILASLDGNVYFMELETGEKTRNPIKLGAPTKGTPSLDPRGYPLLFVGQGLNPAGSETKSNDMYYRVVNLIDGKILYKFGFKTKDPFAYRSWQAYDSSALFNAETDTLIEPGENGILYTVKLNTNYDEAAGT